MRIEQSYTINPAELNGRGEQISIERRYIVFEAQSENDALTYAYSNVAKIVNGMALNNVAVEARVGDDAYVLSARYGSNGRNANYYEVEENTICFDCSASDTLVRQAIAQRRVYGAIDAGTSINWNGKTGGEMEIAGIGVPAPQMRETYTRTMSTHNLTTSYKRRVASMVGRVNQARYHGWERGEVMFMGARYSAPLRGRNSVTVTYEFAINCNEDNAEIGGIACGLKRGWEYVWALSSAMIAGQSPAAAIKAIYIAQVAKYADLSALGV